MKKKKMKKKKVTKRSKKSYGYAISISSELLKKAGLKEGEQLEAKAKRGKIILKRKK